MTGGDQATQSSPGATEACTLLPSRKALSITKRSWQAVCLRAGTALLLPGNAVDTEGIVAPACPGMANRQIPVTPGDKSLHGNGSA